MTTENKFFIWAEKNSIDRQQNLLKNVENVNCDITTEIKSDLMKNVLNDIGSKKQKISGIYKIINKVNGKYYVGSTNYFWNRWRQHRKGLVLNVHKNAHLQSAWNKYGKDAFGFIAIEVVPKEKLIEIEQKYLDIAKAELNKCYNQNFLADRLIMTDAIRRKISKSKMGIPLSDEHKSAIRKTTKKVMVEMRERFMDKTIYTFHNEITGEDFTGWRSELYTKYKDVRVGGIARVVSGERNHHKHWILKKL